MVIIMPKEYDGSTAPKYAEPISKTDIDVLLTRHKYLHDPKRLLKRQRKLEATRESMLEKHVKKLAGDKTEDQSLYDAHGDAEKAEQVATQIVKRLYEAQRDRGDARPSTPENVQAMLQEAGINKNYAELIAEIADSDGLHKYERMPESLQRILDYVASRSHTEGREIQHLRRALLDNPAHTAPTKDHIAQEIGIPKGYGPAVTLRQVFEEYDRYMGAQAQQVQVSKEKTTHKKAKRGTGND